VKSMRLFAIIIFIAVIILAGCDAEPAANDDTSGVDQKNPAVIYDGQGQSKALVYYVKDGFLVPVTFDVESTKEPAKAALDLLFFGLVPKGFENQLSNVGLNSCDIAGDTASVDVSAEFLKGDDKDEREDQLIFTLTEFDNIKKVKISIDGQPLDDLYERPALINKQGKSSSDEAQAGDNYLTVYYADKTKKYIIPVSFESPKIQVKSDEKLGTIPPTAEEKAKAAIEHLIEGPAGISGLTGIFPREVKLKDFYIKDGIAYVDISRDLITSFLDEAEYEKIAVESVVQTLTSIGEIDKVQFLVDGNKIGSIAGHTNISYPISRLKWFNIIE